MKKRILITITDEDFILLERLANGYSKSVIIVEALRELEKVRYPLISTPSHPLEIHPMEIHPMDGGVDF